MNFEQLLLELQTNPSQEIVKSIMGQLSPANINSIIQRAIDTSDKEFKIKLLRLLIGVENSVIIPKLIEAFGKEKDPDAKLLLSVILGKCGNKKIISSLIELIKSTNYLTRMKAIISLQIIGNLAINELLITMFKNLDSNPLFAELISDIICRIPNKTMRDFEKIISIKKPIVAKILGSIDDEKSVSTLIGFLDEKDHILSQAVIDALIFLGPKYADVLGDFLKINNSEYIYWLPRALVKMGKAGLDHLTENLESQNTELIMNIIPIYPYDGSERFKKCLIENLKNGKVELKNIVSEKVIESGDTHLIYECKRLLYKNIDFNTKYFIMKILKKTGKADDVIKEFMEYNTGEKIIVPMILSDYAESGDFNMLINLAGDEDPFISQLSINGLHHISSECFEDIMEYSISDNNKIRKVCISLLKRLGAETEKRINDFLISGNQTQKYHAAFLTGILYLSNCKNALKKLENDGNVWVRKYSKKSLAQLEGPDTFIKFINSSDHEEREIAIDILKDDFSMYCGPIFKGWGQIGSETQESIKKAIIDLAKNDTSIIDELKKFSQISLEAKSVVESLIKQIQLELSFG